jgi:hypothetical protein
MLPLNAMPLWLENELAGVAISFEIVTRDIGRFCPPWSMYRG